MDEVWIAFVYWSLGIGYRSNVQDQIDHAAAATKKQNRLDCN